MNRQQWRLEPANEHTEMKATVTAPIEPTHDEIALHAYLIWEKAGRPPGHEQAYWLQAETQLRLTRQQQANLAAAARPWPPQAPVAPKPAPKLATARASRTPIPAPKPTRLAPATPTVAAKPAAAVKAVAPAKPAARKADTGAAPRRSSARA